MKWRGSWWGCELFAENDKEDKLLQAVNDSIVETGTGHYEGQEGGERSFEKGKDGHNILTMCR